MVSETHESDGAGWKGAKWKENGGVCVYEHLRLWRAYYWSSITCVFQFFFFLMLTTVPDSFHLELSTVDASPQPLLFSFSSTRSACGTAGAR